MIIGLSAIISILALVVFVQFCVWFIAIQKKVVDERVAQFQGDEFYTQAKTAQDSLRKYSATSRKIKSKLKTQNDYWKIITEINRTVPAEIYLKEISIKNQLLEIKGNSLERQALLVFQEKLEKNELFETVESPISNFVSNKNVSFEFTIGLKSNVNQEAQTNPVIQGQVNQISQ